MDPPDKKLSELVDIFKSWIPRRTEPPNVSRDFWMPDQSCRVCYECDSQFTVFNRRHHCRLCGRVFCARCTANSIPFQSDEPRIDREECDRIRVCNYCYKQWEQEIATGDDGIQTSSPGLSPSLSTTSLASAKSSGTPNSSSSTTGSMLYSTGPYQRVPHTPDLSPVQSTQMNFGTDKQDIVPSERSLNTIVDIGDPSPNSFGFCMNRSDDDDDEYGVYRSDSEGRHFTQTNGYYGPVEFDENEHAYGSAKVHCDEENIDTRDLSCSPIDDGLESQELERVNKLREKVEGRQNSDECEASSSIYGAEVTDAEPVDFENNGLLWIPPEPEDEEDEREAVLFDDDDEDATGEWGYLRSSSSFGSGEYRSRDRSSEEHRKVMKNVVDGHFRALVTQLLQVEDLAVSEVNDPDNWLEIITLLSWEAATLLKPDTSKGGGMDPGGYVKIKCLACGLPSESMVVRGVVCKKNVAHRRMTSKIEKPRFLVLGGALEYQRVTNHLSSFDTLLQQEMDHLKMAVAKIDAYHPNVLLVEKSVSRFAQEYLLAKDISLVLNIKRPLLERIARCTGAHIVPSIDHLSSQKLGYCDTFHVDKFLEEHGSAGQGGKKLVKTLMFFEGCPKPLGCTILLKGANGDELKKVKHVLQYGVFAAYHLALETSFLADEGASLPELPLKSPITVALPDKPSNIGRSISTIPGFTTPSAGKAQGHQSSKESESPMRTLTSDLLLPNQNPVRKTDMILSPSFREGPHSHFTELAPSFIDASASVSSPRKFALGHFRDELPPYYTYEKKSKMFRETAMENTSNGFGDLEASVEGVTRTDDTTSNGLVVNQQDAKELPSLEPDCNNSHEEPGSSKEEFPPSPSDHQSILVSLSTRCVWKGTVCERSHLFRIKYYGSFDKPLGRFLRDHLFDQTYHCRSCEMPAEAHVHCYTHRQGSLTISVKKLSEFLLPGEREGKIWMWHRCLRCTRTNGFPPATRRIVMSDAAWGLSFGKFLELSFSNHAAASRVASCGHSLHRDCLRFYGFGRMVACFRYASIDVHSVYLPPSKLDFNYDSQEWILKEANEVVDKAKLLFTEVLNALCKIAEKKIGVGPIDTSVKVDESRRDIAELERMLQKEKVEFEDLSHSDSLTRNDHEVVSCDAILTLEWFGRMVACFRYASIDVHSVYLPPSKLDFNYDSQEWILKEANEVVDKAKLLFTEVLNALCKIAEKKIGVGPIDTSVKVDESRRDIAELERMLQKEKVEFEESLHKTLNKDVKKGQPMIDILEVNRLRRQLLFQSYVWDHRLIYVASVDNSNLQEGLSSPLPKLTEKSLSSNEKLVVINTISIQDKAIHSCDSSLIDVKPRENLNEGGGNGDHRNQIDLVYQGKHTDQESNHGIESQHSLSTSKILGDSDPLESGIVVRRVLSEGQFPVVANLSDTLDAAWTGENHLGNLAPKENGSVLHDVPSTDSLLVEKAVLERPELEEHSEQKGILAVSQSRETMLPIKAVDIMEDSTSWMGMPFLNFYRAFNKNSSENTPKFETLGEYNPVYVALFRKLECQGGARLLLPVGVNDTVVPIYDDEPTSIISYALVSPEYHFQLSDERERPKDGMESSVSLTSHDMMNLNSLHSFDETSSEPLRSFDSMDDSLLSMSGSRSSLALDPLLSTKTSHIRVSFSDDVPLGKVKYTVTCYFARRFDALRRICCPSELDYIRSLSRCKKWGAQGGKSNVFFAKSLDDRFIIKQVTKTELESFIKFAPEYFKYLSESISTGSPTCLAKILGIYQVTAKHLKGGKELKMDVLVMENLLFKRNLTRLYDLKGSARSRYNPDSSGSNKVLLDQNLIEEMPTSPIFVGNKAKRLLERAVWNDTLFLASIDVMDYSLLVGVDENKHELVLGIIDFMRQYTWDKHLETWVKASGILGGPKNTAPTVISPKQYKKRFRKAMSAYFLMVPDQWSPPTIIPSASQSDLCGENTQGGNSLE
ncbi:1-phosphatidylinositol-3-phosphate 5-kinase FAB1A [Thalictrum thalictroides]|uniref:1-phosphatidylinositol-3-phosphate 5-kinase n=1 Tax=Thalictrum thalictroides TaxID=46969 RepID=A0A7J6WAL1_THATH|nr:1-phosphatidylinositol-3-phosphate 5-kinase FAB1A [Thalictrum thalictroides]